MISEAIWFSFSPLQIDFKAGFSALSWRDELEPPKLRRSNLHFLSGFQFPQRLDEIPDFVEIGRIIISFGHYAIRHPSFRESHWRV